MGLSFQGSCIEWPTDRELWRSLLHGLLFAPFLMPSLLASFRRISLAYSTNEDLEHCAIITPADNADNLEGL